MSINHDGRQSPSDDRSGENSSDRTEYDGRTESDLKRLSRDLGITLTAGGWVFDNGEKRPLPADGSREGRRP
jgi:hypothetical protein